MCLTIPAKIIKLNKTTALVKDYNNFKKEILITTLSNLKPNDWILINGNLAIQKISSLEAKEISDLLK